MRVEGRVGEVGAGDDGTSSLGVTVFFLARREPLVRTLMRIKCERQADPMCSVSDQVCVRGAGGVGVVFAASRWELTSGGTYINPSPGFPTFSLSPIWRCGYPLGTASSIRNPSLYMWRDTLRWREMIWIQTCGGLIERCSESPLLSL